jgi:hypothetical protein
MTKTLISFSNYLNKNVRWRRVTQTFCLCFLSVGFYNGVHAATSFQEQIFTESTSIFGSDTAMPESINHSSTVSNTDGSNGTFTATATTAGGQVPKASVGGILTNQLPLAGGALRQVTARVFYDVGIFPVLQAVPPNLLVPLVVNAEGSASVSVTDPTKATFGVTGALLLTLPNAQGGPSASLEYVEGLLPRSIAQVVLIFALRVITAKVTEILSSSVIPFFMFPVV